MKIKKPKQFTRRRLFDFYTELMFSSEDLASHPHWLFTILNSHRSVIYEERFTGFWTSREFNNNDDVTYVDNSEGYWRRYKYDDSGHCIYCESSDGGWYKQEYNKSGKLRCYTTSSEGICKIIQKIKKWLTQKR